MRCDAAALQRAELEVHDNTIMHAPEHCLISIFSTMFFASLYCVYISHTMHSILGRPVALLNLFC